MTCRCSFDREIIDGVPNFLLMNFVCNDHFILASTFHKANHKGLSNHVLELIEGAKHRNLQSAIDRLSEPEIARSPWLTRLQLQNIELVKKHNRDLDEEWGSHIQPPFAFDEHIHETVINESDMRDKAHDHTLAFVVEKNHTHLFRLDPESKIPILTAPISWEWEGKAPDRILHFTISGLSDTSEIEKRVSNNRVKIHGI